MDDAERPKKFGLGEVVVVSLAIIVMGLADAIPWFGPLLDFGFTQFYLGMKGVAGSYQLVMLGSNSITEVISTFPGLGWIGDVLDLLVYWVVVGVDWFAPAEVEEKLEEAGSALQKVEGKGGAAGGAVSGAENAASSAAGVASSEAGAAARTAESGAAGAAGKAAEESAVPNPVDQAQNRMLEPQDEQFAPAPGARGPASREDESEDEEEMAA